MPGPPAEFFRAFLEQCPAGVFVKDADGRWLYANRTLRERFTFAEVDKPGPTAPDLSAPEVDRKIAAYSGEVLSSGRAVAFEVGMTAPDGSEHGWRIIAFRIADGVGQPLLGGLAFDLAKDERAESAARGGDARTRSIVENVIDGIITIDEAGLITAVNPAAERLFGYRSDELIGRNVNVLMPEPFHSGHDRYIENYLRTGAPRIIGIGREVVGRHKDGSTFPMDLAVGEFRLGCRRYFTGIVRDITERKRAEEELLRAKEEAEEANRSKDRFLAMLSHELRTPLTPVLATISYVEGLPDLPPDLRDEVATIRRNVEMEARLIDDLLDLTRIGRGKIRLEREVLDVHASLRAALEVCQDEIGSKGLEVSLALRAREHHVLGDPARLQQVFWNLVQNAVKYTPAVGGIRLSSADAGERRVAIRVADTGAGIDPAFLPRIFNAFEQGESATARQHGGLGLGLAIARMLVELHGGTLTASSEGRDRGATFTVDLETISPPESVPRPIVPAPRAPGRALKILFVEDNPDTSRSIARLLRASGFEVETAANVRDALRSTARERFDLLLSDIGLPDGSGLEVMRHARERFGLRGIAFSGYGTDDDVRESRVAGFDHHLTKPVSIGTLIDLIRRTVS